LHQFPLPLVLLTIGLIGLLPVPAAAQSVAPAIAFGTRHAVALAANGDVLTWGDNVMCQLGRAGGNASAMPGLVLRNGIAIAAAAEHSLALTADGRVYGWGSNPQGALGAGNTFDQCEGPSLIASLADKTVVQIATGHGFSLALSSAGDLYCSGDNSMGQCPVAKGGAIASFARVPIPELAGSVVAVKAGSFHALALTKDGGLFAFGRGRDGQLGNGGTANGVTRVPGLAGVVSFAAGTWHSAAALDDGSVWLWGNNHKSQLCDATMTSRAAPGKVAMTPGVKVTEVTAGGHATLMRSANGELYACGDNQFGALGADKPAVVAFPALVAGGTRAVAMAVGGANGAFSTDGCTVRVAGSNDRGVANAGGDSAAAAFAVRANLSLCGARPAAALPNLLRVRPSGGVSHCWTPRTEEDDAAAPRFAPLRQAMLAVEAVLAQNAAFMAAPVPVRMRTSFSASDGGARMHVKAAPERKADGTRLWTAACGVIPQLDRIGGAITQISVFFNTAVRSQFVNATGSAPKPTGRAGGYPEYNGWVLITKDGRLPWIPQTLADRLDIEGARRREALADWARTRSGMKAVDPAAVQKTFEMLQKTDPVGAGKYLTAMREQAAEIDRQQKDVHPATTAGLEQQVAEYEKYRASFSPEQLRAPAVWGDESGDGKRRLDAGIAALRQLTAEEQRQVDDWGRQARVLERAAQAEAAGKNTEAAARLRAQSNELGLNVRAVRQARLEKAGPLMSAAGARYELTNLQPGPAERAMRVKPDPTFPDAATPGRIQMISISFSQDPDARQVERRAWQQQVRDTFDFAALAALLQ
jgi:hypothetical protein